MGQVLHGSARTTQAIRRRIQRSQESLQALAKRHSIDPKTVAIGLVTGVVVAVGVALVAGGLWLTDWLGWST